MTSYNTSTSRKWVHTQPTSSNSSSSKNDPVDTIPKLFHTAIRRALEESSLYKARTAWRVGLQGHPDAKAILDGIENGFSILSSAPTSLPDNSAASSNKNLGSAKENPDFITKKIGQELVAGRLLPVRLEWLAHVRTSPLGQVPKQPTGNRLIHHLSAPAGTSINDTIDKDDARAQYGSVDQATAALVERGAARSWMFKIDFKDAFRHVRVRPQDVPQLGMHWDGTTYVDLCLPFGLRSSPHLFVKVAGAALWIALNRLSSESRHVRDALTMVHYLDDFLGIISDRDDAGLAMDVLVRTFTDLGLTVNDGKCVRPTQSVTFLGIELDAVNLIARLPEEKRLATTQLVASYRLQSAATKRQLLSLAGSLFHACKVVPPGRPFMATLLSAAYSVAGMGEAILLSDQRALLDDLHWWSLLLSRWNGRHMLVHQPTTPDLKVQTDASSTIGYGITYNDEWSYGRWDSALQPYAIHVKELLPIVAAAHLWGSRWTGRRVIFVCDNIAVVHALNNGLPRDGVLRRLVRLLMVASLSFSFTYEATHVAGVLNIDADDLSRGNIANFRSRSGHSFRSTPTLLGPELLRLLATAANGPSPTTDQR